MAPIKVSGSSFGSALYEYCGDGDVISEKAFSKFTNYFNGRCFKDMRHISSKGLRDQLPKNIWDNYLKVSIVRCPYDTLISNYYFDYYLRKQGDLAEEYYEDFDVYTAYKFKLRNYLMLCINNRSAMDYIIRYENSEEDIKSLEIKIGCKGLLETYRNCQKKRGIRYPGQDVYTVYSKHPIAAAIIEKYAADHIQNELIKKYYPLYKKRLYQRIKKPGYASKIMAGLLRRNPSRYSRILGYIRPQKPLIGVEPPTY